MNPMKGSKNKARLDGKVVAITGANSGIGKETALDLSRRGARVLMLCRSMDKAEEAADEIKKQNPTAKLDIHKLDLSSMASVRACAEKLLDCETELHYLVNNAGLMNSPKAVRTEDGFDGQFGTNHLGHFLLTEMLMPLIKKAATPEFRPRIVILSSMAHTYGSMHWDDLNWEKGYSANDAYCQSKLANVLHARELARRVKADGISVYAVHPGVVATELWRHTDKRWYGKIIWPAQKVFFKTPLQGAQTTLYCLLEESIVKDSGKYYADCKEKRPSDKARNDEDAKRLWGISEKMVGLDQ